MNIYTNIKFENCLYLFKSGSIFNHIFDNISFVLTKHNIPHKIITSIIFIKRYDSFDKLWLGIWNDTDICPKNYITLNTEPLKRKHWIDKLQDKIQRSIYIIDYTYTHSSFYNNWNLKNYKIMPFGYCENNELVYQQSIKKDIENIKDIDVLFYGSMTNRRHYFYDHISEFCYKNNLNFIFRHNDLYNYKEKSDIISRSKIVLSIAHEENLNTNDTFRLSFLLSNKAFFLCEKMGDIIFEDEVKDCFIFYEGIEELKSKILYYVNNEKARDIATNNIYNYCKKNMNIVDTFPIENIKKLLSPTIMQFN